MNKYIFDVDGTLTPSRGKIDPDFHDWFLDFCKNNHVFLVTGSDYPKTLEQLGEEICYHVKRVYNCSGSDVWMQGQNIHTNDWEIDDFTYEWLEAKLESSDFEIRTGNHIEERPGMVNFSVVGRNATKEERAAYVEYDTKFKERETIAREFNYIFGAESSQLRAVVGGETGIDIFPIGADKSQIIEEFSPRTDIIFFGDRIDPHGNDWPLAVVNTEGTNHHVRDWKHTWEILKDYANTRNQ